MKALSSKSLGQSRESLTALYKHFFRMPHACHLDLARSHVQVLQRSQNSTLCIATICTTVTTTAQLQAETKALPLKNYLNLRGTQIFAAAAVTETLLHKELHNPLEPWRHRHITLSSHNAGYDSPSPARKFRTLMATRVVFNKNISYNYSERGPAVYQPR